MSTATRIAFGERTVPDRLRWMRKAVDLSPDPVWGVPTASDASRTAAVQYAALLDAFPCVQLHADLGESPAPAAVRAIGRMGGRFFVAGATALRALLAAGADAARVIDATPFTGPAAFRAVYERGVRRYLVGSVTRLAAFAGAPHDALVVLRVGGGAAADDGIAPRDALRALRNASTAGIDIAGLSLGVTAAASPCDYVAALAEAIGIMADARAATGRRFALLDLGSTFPGRAADPAERAELARAIRALVSPATSGIVVTAATALFAPRGEQTWAPAG